MKQARHPIILFFALALALGARAQYPIQVSVQLVPPYSPQLDDYRSKALLRFRNSSRQDLDVYLRGSIQNDRGQVIRTMPNVFTNVPVHVPALQSVVLMGAQVDDNYLDPNNLEKINFSQDQYNQLQQFGLLPDGLYTFCVYAYARNANGNYTAVSDPQGAGTCFSFPLSYVVPPRLLSPLDESTVRASVNQMVNFTWTRPVGALQASNIVYDLYVVKVIPGEDPRQSLVNAVQNGAGIFFRQPDIPITNFQFSNQYAFPLDSGSQYAVMVQARDLNNKIAFENGGRSQTETFTYAPTAPAVPVQAPVAATPAPPASSPPPAATSGVTGNFTCSCRTDVSGLDQSDHSASVAAGGKFTIGSVPVTVASVQRLADNTLSGAGTIVFNKVPVRVSFSGVLVNKDGIAYRGTATGAASGPPVSFPGSDLTDFLTQLGSQNLSAPPGAGLTLPFGLTTLVPNDAVNIGVTGLTITPQQAAFDALAVVRLAEANEVLALKATGICFSGTSGFCQDALFRLSADLPVGKTGLTLRHYLSDADPGTYVLYSSGALQKFHISADYDCSALQLTALDGSPLKPRVDADIKSWTDWTADVTVAPFKLGALGGFTFTLGGSAKFDHSDTQNPAGMPTSFSDPNLSEKNAAIQSATWRGIYIPSVTVGLPSIVKNTGGGSGALQIGTTNLIIDEDGITGFVGAENVLPLESGSLGGWYCSVDHIGISILNSSFRSGGMNGSVVLPLSDHTKSGSAIAWNCTLTTTGSSAAPVFQLTASTTQPLDFSAWVARLSNVQVAIQATYNGGTGDVSASADVSGTLGIQASIKGVDVNLDLISVQDLKVQTAAPYVTGGHFSFASPQHFLSGFPISITNVQPSFSGGEIGLQFDFGVNLSDLADNLLPSATSTIVLNAKLNLGQHVTFQPADPTLKKIVVQGGLAGVIQIDHGEIDFIDDSKWGKCVYGGLKATITGLASLDCNVRFGHTKDPGSFSYFYFDAYVDLGTGIPVGPDISINGVGGGVWYNMRQTANNDPTLKASDYLKDPGKYQRDAFAPSQGSFGFEFKLGLGTSDGQIFRGYGDLSATFGTSGGFSVESIEGKFGGRVLTPGGDGLSGGADIKAELDLTFDIADKIYDLKAFAVVDYPDDGSLLDASGTFELLADVGKGTYAISLGTPQSRIQAKLVDLVDMDAYLVAGTGINAQIPDPDPMVDLSSLKGHYTKPNFSGDKGVLFGAAVQFSPPELDYLFFYLKITAAIGFDVAVMHADQGCDPNNPAVLPGVDGWYGTGQLYGKLTGELGAQVDFFFFSGRVKALDVDAAFLFQCGFPNPNWFRGTAALDYNILDGYLTGSVDFDVQWGKMCVPKVNVFKMPLIQAMKPDDGTANVPLNADPEVIFNYPVESPFSVTVLNSDGNQEDHTFYLKIQQCLVTNQDKNRQWASYGDPNSQAAFTGSDHKDMYLSPDAALDPQTNYAFSITVQAFESATNNAGDSKPVYQDGQPVQMTQMVNFKTGDCKPADYVSDPATRIGAFPFPNQRYFLPGESKQGAILLDKTYPCYGGSGSDPYVLVARFTAVRAHQVLGTWEKPVKGMQGDKVMYDLPSLPANCLVRVEIVKRKALSIHEQQTMQRNNASVLTAVNRGQGARTMSNEQYQSLGIGGLPSTIRLNGYAPASQQLRLSNKQVNIVLYTYHFRTSRFSTLDEKIRNMNYAGTGSYDYYGSPTVTVSAAEKFDRYDVSGFYSYVPANAGKTYFSMPLVKFKQSPNYSPWLRNYAIPCVYGPAQNLGFNIDSARWHGVASAQDLQDIGVGCGNDPYCLPLRAIEVNSADEPLSAQEIYADETEDQLPQGMAFGHVNSNVILNQSKK